MKIFRKPVALLFVLVTCALFAAPQISINAQQPSGALATANNVQLVIEGKVVSVHDGDTVTVVDQDSKKFNIRLQGIDAPELKQEFGAASQKNLSGMVLGKQVSILWNKVDKYRRTVGTIMLDGRDINIEQVKAGVAWHFKKYEDEQSPTERHTYAAAELSARAAKLGLWKNENPLPPGDWRQEVKTKRWGPPPPPATIIGSANSKKYHRPDCPGYRDMAERNRVFFQSVSEAEAAGFKRAGNCPAELVATNTTPARAPITVVSSVAESRAASIAQTVPLTLADNGGWTWTQEAHPNSQNSQVPLKIVGNLNSKKFHLPSCAGYAYVAEKNRIFFASVAEAEAAGYERAGNCSPETAEVINTPAPSAVSPATTVIEPRSTLGDVEGTPEVKSGQVQVKIVGNKNSKIFHRPECSGYDRVSEKNRVYFNSAAEAQTAGYRIAKNCSVNNAN